MWPNHFGKSDLIDCDMHEYSPGALSLQSIPEKGKNHYDVGQIDAAKIRILRDWDCETWTNFTIYR